MINNNIEFLKVTGSNFQIKILFKLLEKRSHNISHDKIPDYYSHEKFVKNNPYKEWYLVAKNKEFIGSFYIKHDNSVGLNLSYYSTDILSFIINFIKNNFTPEKEIASLIPPYFYINTSSTNMKLHCILNELKLRSIQISYKI